MKWLLPSLLLLPSVAFAHVGSPDVFLEGKAGPYQIYATVRPPEVIPGVADVEVRIPDAGGAAVHIVPTPLVGDAARFAPMADLAKPLAEDPTTFSGHLWMMSAGSWQVRITVDGPRGPGELSVPVPALPLRTKQMQSSLGIVLGGLGLLLVFAFAAIAAAAARESTLDVGAEVDRRHVTRARVVGGAVLAILVLGVWGGWGWWQKEAQRYDGIIYKPLGLQASVEPHGEGGAQLRLQISNPAWLKRSNDDFLPDHDHLMHLFIVSTPSLERVWHLHPTRDSAGQFVIELPPMPAGTFRIYADVVHQSGMPETATADLTLAAPVGNRVLDGDDATGSAPPFDKASARIAPLGDGAQMVWLPDDGPLVPRKPHSFRFRVEDKPGHAAEDMELYMGMLGHAMFLKPDGSMFAHIHPSGSVPMAALALTETSGNKDPHSHHMMMGAPSEIGFFYGLPQAGAYRLFVQIKRAGHIQTATFDMHL